MHVNIRLFFCLHFRKVYVLENHLSEDICQKLYVNIERSCNLWLCLRVPCNHSRCAVWMTSNFRAVYLEKWFPWLRVASSYFLRSITLDFGNIWRKMINVDTDESVTSSLAWFCSHCVIASNEVLIFIILTTWT